MLGYEGDRDFLFTILVVKDDISDVARKPRENPSALSKVRLRRETNISNTLTTRG